MNEKLSRQILIDDQIYEFSDSTISAKNYLDTIEIDTEKYYIDIGVKNWLVNNVN